MIDKQIKKIHDMLILFEKKHHLKNSLLLSGITLSFTIPKYVTAITHKGSFIVPMSLNNENYCKLLKSIMDNEDLESILTAIDIHNLNIL